MQESPLQAPKTSRLCQPPFVYAQWLEDHYIPRQATASLNMAKNSLLTYI